VLISSAVGWNQNTDVSLPVIQLPAVFRRVHMERLGSYWTDFYEIWHLNIFRKSVEKIQVSLKSDKNNECLTCRPIHIFVSYLAQFLWDWEMFQTKVVEKIKTHILYSITFFRKSYHEWDNVENIAEPGRTQMTIWRMRVACWITKLANAPQCYVIRTLPLWSISSKMTADVTAQNEHPRKYLKSLDQIQGK
jgi:hypothetical protein